MRWQIKSIFILIFVDNWDNISKYNLFGGNYFVQKFIFLSKLCDNIQHYNKNYADFNNDEDNLFFFPEQNVRAAKVNSENWIQFSNGN